MGNTCGVAKRRGITYNYGCNLTTYLVSINISTVSGKRYVNQLVAHNIHLCMRNIDIGT